MEENVEEMDNRIDSLNKLVPKDHQENVRELITAIIEIAQEEAFLDGYRYAITVLNAGFIKKNQKVRIKTCGYRSLIKFRLLCPQGGENEKVNSIIKSWSGNVSVFILQLRRQIKASKAGKRRQRCDCLSFQCGNFEEFMYQYDQ